MLENSSTTLSDVVASLTGTSMSGTVSANTALICATMIAIMTITIVCFCAYLIFRRGNGR